MRPPDRSFYEDDDDGYEVAWAKYEEACEDARDRKRDEEAEREIDDITTNDIDL